IFLLNGAATQLRALLVRGLRFRWLAGTDVIASALALGVALLGALAGWEYWALVAQQLTQALVVLLGVTLGVGHLPGLPRRGVPMRSFLRFGGNLVLSHGDLRDRERRLRRGGIRPRSQPSGPVQPGLPGGG